MPKSRIVVRVGDESVNKSKSVKRKFFMGDSAIKEVALEEGIKEIGVGAFARCSRLESVSMPDSLLKIEGSAFYRCGKLSEAKIPSNVKTIGNWARLIARQPQFAEM